MIKAINWFVYLDDYEYADYTAANSYKIDEYMMSSNIQPNFLSYEMDLETDLLALESNDYGSDYSNDYMMDWDTLFGSSSSPSSFSSSFQK